jgi:integrase/recombinase XerC
MATKSLDQASINILVQDDDLLEWVTQFMLDRKSQNMSRNTLNYYRKDLQYFLRFCQTQMIERVSEVNPNLLRAFLDYLETMGHNPGGRKGIYSAVRAFLHWWEAETEPEGWKNPIKRVKAPRVEQEPLDPISREDFDKLQETCKKDWYGIRDRAILQTLLDSGVRAGELISLNLGDLDINNGEILVRHSKNKKPRYTFVGATTRRSLRKWLQVRGVGPGPLFLSDDEGGLSFWGLVQIIRRRSAKAGIKQPGLHDFRRAFCLAQLQAGTPEVVISRLMGHSSTVLISRYAKQSGIDIRQLYHSVVD